jgi:hypothetical protein
MLDRQLENPPCRVSLEQARVRELWIKIHRYHIPFCGIHYLYSLGPDTRNLSTPIHTLQGPVADQTAESPRTPVEGPKSCLGQGKHPSGAGPWLPWSFFTLSPWISSTTLPSRGNGATVPIHTTMAQPLLFSNSGRNLEPIRRRMARRGMRVASEAYTVPYQCNNPCPD